LVFLRGFPIPAAVLTPEQLRAARVLIRWTRKRLSDEAGVPLKTTEAFEQGRTSPMMRTEHKWRRALERAGVIFIDSDDTAGPGVRLKARPKD
jgi:transcriptional regulator with XRE-family HTH domain